MEPVVGGWAGLPKQTQVIVLLAGLQKMFDGAGSNSNHEVTQLRAAAPAIATGWAAS